MKQLSFLLITFLVLITVSLFILPQNSALSDWESGMNPPTCSFSFITNPPNLDITVYTSSTVYPPSTIILKSNGAQLGPTGSFPQLVYSWGSPVSSTLTADLVDGNGNAGSCSYTYTAGGAWMQINNGDVHSNIKIDLPSKR